MANIYLENNRFYPESQLLDSSLQNTGSKKRLGSTSCDVIILGKPPRCMWGFSLVKLTNKDLSDAEIEMCVHISIFKTDHMV